VCSSDLEFNFATVYSSPENYNSKVNWMRQWRGVSLLSKNKMKPRDMLPFSFVPRKKLKPADLFSILRDHYEESEYAPALGENDSPNQPKYNAICTEDTRYSFVAHLRDGLPAEFASLVWLSFTGPDTNAFSPWYISIAAPPEGYSTGNSETAFSNHFKYPRSIFSFNPEYAYCYFSRLSTLINQRYIYRYKIARKEWENFEDYALKIQRKMEKEFDYMVKKNKYIALKHISNYVYKMEYRKWFLASELIGEVSKK
jgi:dipeptidase